MGHFTAFEDDADIDFVTILQELTAFLCFGLQVVHANLHVDLDFLELSGLGFTLVFLFGFFLFKSVFAVVEDFAHGRVGVRGNAEEVEVVTGGELICAAGRHMPEVFSVRSDDLYHGITDILVDRVQALQGAMAIVLVIVSYG